MENASKALVIAGAILISILIIGLGVFIYNGAASTVNKANLNSEDAQAQNQKFEAYFGDKKSAAEVKQLMSLVRSNNITSDNGSEQKSIGITFGNKTLKPSEVSSQVKAGNTYKVEVANDAASDLDAVKPGEEAGTQEPDKAYYKSGFIRWITITEYSGKGSSNP